MDKQLFPVQINDNATVYQGDCLEIMPLLEQKVELIFSDPPYGNTHCRWDSVIDFSEMWQQIHRLSFDNTPVLLFSQIPFTCTLGCSNLKNLRYNWVWEKTQATGFLNAKKMPLKCHEDILVFYRKLPKYHPIKTAGHQRKVIKAVHQQKCSQGDIYQNHSCFSDYDSTERYPRSVLQYKSDKQLSALHPTQKPVPLLEYLIKTYTDAGDTVLDFAMGSGSAGIAALNTGRKFIGIEKDVTCFTVAKERLAQWKSQE